jgi:hypothetical protein
MASARRSALIICILVLISLQIQAAGRDYLCVGAITLEDLIACIQLHLPQDGSGCYHAPDGSTQIEWSSVIDQMLSGSCAEISMPVILQDAYILMPFTDVDNDKTYCVLMENTDADQDGWIDKGWGTFIVDPFAENELNIEIPHPHDDVGTEQEGIVIFKTLNARSFLMAGTSPYASSAFSTCQMVHLESDVAHNTTNLFHPAAVEIYNYYHRRKTDFLVIQFHGMSITTCPEVDVYLTHGTSDMVNPESLAGKLKTLMRIQNPDWTISSPGDLPSCTLNGATNIQGRLFNNVDPLHVCDAYADGFSQNFIHIEQKPECRFAAFWICALQSLLPITIVPVSEGLSIVLLLSLFGIFFAVQRIR